MPRRAWILMALVALAAPAAMGATLLPGTIQGQGTASNVRILPGEGLVIEGGAYEWNYVCADCPLRVTIVDGLFVFYEPTTGSVTLEPGEYELREFRGLLLRNDVAPFEFQIQVHGFAKLERVG